MEKQDFVLMLPAYLLCPDASMGISDDRLEFVCVNTDGDGKSLALFTDADNAKTYNEARGYGCELKPISRPDELVEFLTAASVAGFDRAAIDPRPVPGMIRNQPIGELIDSIKQSPDYP